MIQVKIFKYAIADLPRKEYEMNAWLAEAKPILEEVTHEIHANTHWFTVWYLAEIGQLISKAKRETTCESTSTKPHTHTK